MKKTKILFVCLGNICRSPMAQAIFQQKIREKNLRERFYVDSCGTGHWHVGEDPDPRTLQTLANHNIPFKHKARQIRKQDIQNFDYILCMDKTNREQVLAMYPGAKEKTFLIRDFDPLEQGKDVPDPYWDSINGFEKVYEMLDRSIENFLKQFEENNVS